MKKIKHKKRLDDKVGDKELPPEKECDNLEATEINNSHIFKDSC